eukprot:jgi/Hompol1/5052/HPOL_001876-RA
MKKQLKLQLRNQIETIKDQRRKDSNKELKTLMNVGCDVFMQARIPDTSKIIIKVGLDVFIEMELDDAIAFLNRREKSLEDRSERMTTKASEIRAHIKLVLKAIED